MLRLNTGVKFAKNNGEFISMLFTKESTPDGTYKVMKSGIRLYNLQGELFAFIVNNKYGERFFVSARPVKTDKGRNSIRYNYALSSLDEKYLGLTDYGHMPSINCAIDAINQIEEG